jgi:glycosyltransferase involved in cell wall biosynthesis
MNVLYIQSRTSKGGAQHALFRIISQLTNFQISPALLYSENGWLNKTLYEHFSFPLFQIPSPSSRSILSRFGGLKAWGYSSAKILRSAGFHPDIIHANEYFETPYALELARRFDGCRVVTHLRSALMRPRDYLKYRCHHSDQRILVGERFAHDIGGFVKEPSEIIFDFLLPTEFFAPRKLSSAFPGRILILGNPHPNKGWDLAVEALHLFDRAHPGLLRELHFTGQPSITRKKKLLSLRGDAGFRLVFHDKVPDLAQFARRFELAVSPSLYESFGLANLEVLAAGVPLLCSDRGEIPNSLVERWIFKPDTQSFYRCLEENLIFWKNASHDLDKIIENLRKRFSAEDSMTQLRNLYERLLGE